MSNSLSDTFVFFFFNLGQYILNNFIEKDERKLQGRLWIGFRRLVIKYRREFESLQEVLYFMYIAVQISNLSVSSSSSPAADYYLIVCKYIR